MSDYIEVTLAAVNRVAKAKLSKDDQHVPGMYSVWVQKGLSETTMTAAALDAFHQECPVSELDDFDFYVLDPASQRVLEEDAEIESYTNGHLARNPQLISDKLPRFYSVKVGVTKEDQSVVQVGHIQLAEENKQSAGERALRLLNDACANAQGVSTKVEVTPHHR